MSNELRMLEIRDAVIRVPDDLKHIPLVASDSAGTPWVVLGGPDYAVQIRHLDGGYLRISWDGTITSPAPPEVSL